MVLTQPFTSKSDQGTDTVKKILWERKAISDLTDPFTVSLHKHLYQQNRPSRNCFKWHGYWRALEIRSSYLKGTLSLHNSWTTLPNTKMKIILNPQLIFFSSKLQISWWHIRIHLTSPLKISAIHQLITYLLLQIDLCPYPLCLQAVKHAICPGNTAKPEHPLLICSSWDIQDKRLSKDIAALTLQLQTEGLHPSVTKQWKWKVIY